MQYAVAHRAQVVLDDDDPDVAPLITLFNETFYATYNTRLIKGGDEPVYLPAGTDMQNVEWSGDTRCDYHQIVFAHGYFSSALHEVAHWCIAGEKRRLLEDYGYWYCPDGRDAKQQFEFEQVEVKPQALEWAMTVAAGRRFQVSTDNLNGVEPDRAGFTARVRGQLVHYIEHGFPRRAEMFITALQKQFNGPSLTATWLEKEYPDDNRG
ncbi:MAG: elongation factor P hydroxylase [Alteromonadaceae bacterium]|nr:elongation factor P hydroxylase [Alteromonadaceae bacterium]